MKKQIVCCTAALLLAAGGLGALPEGISGTAVVASAATYGDYEYSVKSGSVTITGYKGKGGDVVIPSEINGKKVTCIGESAFENCDSLTSITLPDSVTSIEMGAFFYCENLKSITLSKSLTKIAWNVFGYCTALKSIDLPDSLTSIGQSSFSSCTGLTSMIIPDSVTTIESGAFDSCKNLTSVTIGKGFSDLGEYVFSGCSKLTEINIDSKNKTYSSFDGAVYKDKTTALILCPEGKTSLAFPDTVTTICKMAFDNCPKLTSVTLPESVTRIESLGFSTCLGLKSITIPGSVESIGDNAFSCCDNLKSVTLGEGLKEIDYQAFLSCNKLKTLILPSSISKIGDHAIGFDCDEYYYNPIDGFTLYCYPGVGEKYAKNNKINYKLINGDVTNAKIKLTKGDYYVYQGKAIRPAVKVTLDGKTLKANTDYKVVYKKNDAPGKASVVVKGAGSYTGRAVKKFFIKPATSKIMKVTSPKNGAVKLSWKRDTLSDGYVLYVSYNNFKSVAKKVYIKKNATAAKTITGLRSGRKCYVKMRAYKLVDGKKLTGKCSKVVTVKCK